jgi:hypothetical protein
MFGKFETGSTEWIAGIIPSYIGTLKTGTK